MEIGVKEASGLLEVSEKTIYRWIREQVLPVYRLNDQYRFNRAELLEWATARNLQVDPNLFSESAAGKVELPSLAAALKAGGVAYAVGGDDQPSVLRAIVGLLKLPDSVDRDFLFQILQARESLGSTGVGDGIAIPHVRNPLVQHVSQPTVTLCFLATPIDFHALDGKPVNTLFTLICPTIKIHLNLLSRLGFVLRDPAFKNALGRQASAEELMAALIAAEKQIKS